VLAVMLAWVDQTLVPAAMMTRLPSSEIMSSGEAGLETGLSPLALHTGVSLGTLWNQGAVWFIKYNVKGNGNGLDSITGGNKFE
jgi:hypothetical protein